ncbi:isoleucine--tRNA ligase [Candidatus Gottesmanbacteria bacterium]|nr:isoleucine--tRNA ligase [Candidatus Gottesmanbacteria bacterium]
MVKNHAFKPVSPQVSFPALEQEVLDYWKKNKIFEKSIESRPKDKTWTFLDGPPFITGLPHYGTLLSSIPKDLFPRYWTMKGYRVRRVWGWDCHGLPAENKVESKLHIKRKKDIEEKIGVKKFIDECKLYVGKTSSEWEWYVDHIGRWVDFRNAYKTMDTPYMETVMWVFKQMYDKGLIYKGLRVSLYCPHCGTPISNFEVAMDADNYKEVTESTAVFMYQLVGDKNTYLLAWSTTPWNKLATPALAVNPLLEYVKVKQGDKFYILAKSTMKMLKNDPPYTIVQTMKGKELVGKKFIPHYDFYKVDPGKKAFVIVGGDFVTADEGTGIVTIAAYGEEDLAVMQKESIQLVLHVDDEGMLKSDVPKWAGKYYLDVDPLVIENLKERGLIYRVDSYTHTVPTCWRCHTRLYYAPQDAWYVDVKKLKPAMYKTNEAVNWFPSHFKYGRFLKSMEAAPDWCISRSRYWGSPVPVWECKNGHRFVPGSIAELEKASGITITSLHKPEIDEVVVPCQECKEKATRVSEVLDSWIEAGSASFAERHFPFEKGVKLEDFFPPDFIVEYTGQIRAWFYVLHVISTALYATHAFKNVVVSGVILGTDGRKMSKNYGNYPDPKEMLESYGGDALRLYLLSSPVMHGEDIRISELEYRNQVRGILLLLWNVYNFFITYANTDRWSPRKSAFTPIHVMDRWILSRLNGNIHTMTENGYEKYDTPEIVGQTWMFMRDLSLWYVRRIRDRVGPNAPEGKDKDGAYQTLWFVLTQYCKALAPLVPFVTEEIFRNLTGHESVHLESWPSVGPTDEALEKEMQQVHEVVEKVHSIRKEQKIKVRQPLKSLVTVTPIKLSDDSLRVLEEELNVKNVTNTIGDFKVDLDLQLNQELIQEGQARELIRNIQILRKEKGCKIDERVAVVAPKEYQALSGELLETVKRETLTSKLIWGEKLSISTG